MHEKSGPPFNCQSIYARFGITTLELNMAPGVLPEPYMSQGGQGVAETPIVSKGLMPDIDDNKPDGNTSRLGNHHTLEATLFNLLCNIQQQEITLRPNDTL